jgi:hypothetical protein
MKKLHCLIANKIAIGEAQIKMNWLYDWNETRNHLKNLDLDDVKLDLDSPLDGGKIE